MNPADFGFKDKIDPYYFSVTTMSAVGYGDLSPKTRGAKLLVMSQQLLLLTGEITLLTRYLHSVANKAGSRVHTFQRLKL